MDLNAAIGLRSGGRQIEAGAKKAEPRFEPVHAGAHARFVRHKYIHTGNKTRGGITTSHYFKRDMHGGNSREVTVQADGSYIKLSRTAKGMRRRRGRIDAAGCEAATPESKIGHSATKQQRSEKLTPSQLVHEKGVTLRTTKKED